MYKKILVPLDGSELSEKALAHAEAIAGQFGSQLFLARVCETVPLPVMPEMAVPSLDYVQLEKAEAEEEARAYLAAARERLVDKGFEVTSLVLEGPVSESILDAAAAQEIDLIVMSTHGRSGLGRWIFGSVANKVLQGAPCPMLIVRPQRQRG